MGYILKRIATSLPLIFGVCFLSFLIMQLAPGDPTLMYMDPNVNAEDLEQVRKNLGLDQPILFQFFYWFKQLIQGNLGYSYVTGKPVFEAIFERLPATLLLSVSSLILILLITFPLGIICGYKKDTWVDDSITVFSFLGLSIPTFWLGLMFILLFSIQLNLFPTSGFLDPLLMDAPIFTKGLNILQHMFLPLITIIIGGIAGLIRYNRFSMIKILAQDYITSAKARGLKKQRILFKHALKNALLPIITILGLDLPSLISGSFIIEYIFSWPGMGQLGVQSVFQRDYPVLMATILFSSFLIILGNLLADISYAYADPRISKTTKRKPND
ncbi:MAG: ABC transporter permease [Candidatus Marinamargulisbacteria bacterium]